MAKSTQLLCWEFVGKLNWKITVPFLLPLAKNRIIAVLLMCLMLYVQEVPLLFTIILGTFYFFFSNFVSNYWNRNCLFLSTICTFVDCCICMISSNQSSQKLKLLGKSHMNMNGFVLYYNIWDTIQKDI